MHQGRLPFHLRDGAVRLGRSEMYVVPRAVEHKPEAGPAQGDECEFLPVESAGTVYTGTTGGAPGTAEEPWI